MHIIAALTTMNGRDTSIRSFTIIVYTPGAIRTWAKGVLNCNFPDLSFCTLSKFRLL